MSNKRIRKKKQKRREERALNALIVQAFRNWEDEEMSYDSLPELTQEESRYLRSEEWGFWKGRYN
jgi:hypothetical protein